MDKALAASYLLSLDKFLARRGISDYLEQLSFDTSKAENPNAYLSSAQVEESVIKAYELSACDELGLLFGKTLSIANHGFLGYAAMSSATIKMALETALRFLRIRTRIIKADLKHDNGRTYIELTVDHDNPIVTRFLIEMITSHIVELREFLMNNVVPLILIEVQYAKPSYDNEYQAILHTEIKFEEKHNRIWAYTDDLNQQISYADEASFQLALSQLQTALESLEDNDELPTQIKNILTSTELHTQNMERIASELFMSSRTLRRRLEKFGVTYKEIVDEVRKQKAIDYLAQGDMSVTEISFLLGFNDTSSFSKAFKRWTGVSPSEYK